MNLFYAILNISYGSETFVMRLDGTSNSRFVPPIVDENESINTLSSALELNSAQGYGDASPIRGRLEKADVDFFKITAGAPGYLNIAFVSPSIGGNAVVTLIDINGNPIYSTQKSSLLATKTIPIFIRDHPHYKNLNSFCCYHLQKQHYYLS